jgi:hypothetical protein
MLQPMRNYPFAKGLSFMPRGTWRPIDKWIRKSIAPAASGGTRDYDTIIDPGVPPAVRAKVIAAVMYGGAFAQTVCAEVAEMVDDGRLDPSAAASILRALNASERESGTAQGGDGGGGDGPGNADGWAGMGGPDRGPAWFRDAISGGEGQPITPVGAKASALTMRKVPMDGLNKPRNRRG